ncbi:MAG: Glutamate-1-semialdehyde 2,1-aminomutase [Candidatus Heimdallarchaeota archaeon LC_3]|nr:MAG: Glutamate-1-semialdehyde 2,1-aminomutase [Candidatus Heimdallarchaeota archaeon LC_3]
MSSNMDLLDRAKKVMPGGVSSPVRAFKAVGGFPKIIKKASGAKIYDIDGNEFIDYCMSFGPLIAGHAHPKIVKAIQKTVENGTSFGATNQQEIILAERIVQNHPSADWVRFVNSGTEAVMSAIRLARTATKRDIIIKFDGCYHGHTDALLVKAGSGLATFGIIDSDGVPESISKHTIVLPLGDISRFRSIMQEFENYIAAVIIEGIPANNGLLIQTKEFMKSIESIAHQYGALLILDEVITGFRIGFEGATGYYNLKPDIITLGKIIGGGLPIGAYCGKIELMDLISPLGSMYQAGTLSGNPLAVVAGNTMLDIIQSTSSFYSDLESKTLNFAKNLKRIFDEQGIPVNIPAIASLFWVVQQENIPNSSSEISNSAINYYSKFHKKSMDKGLYLPPSAYEVWFLSSSHDSTTLDVTLSKIKSIIDGL